MAAGLRDAILAEILSSRALVYRRMCLALGVPLVGVYFLGSAISYDNLNVFGVKISPGSDQRSLIMTLLWGAYLYHVIGFTYCALRDFKSWALA
jgi:hypothetical protein